MEQFVQYGDQLTARCPYSDHSVNCQNADAFVTEVKRQQQMMNILSLITFVATNEKESWQLNILKNAGIYIAADLYPKFNDVDSYVFDLIMGCYVYQYLDFGESQFDGFMRQCRQ